IRDFHVTGVQTCALPIAPHPARRSRPHHQQHHLTPHRRPAPMARYRKKPVEIDAVQWDGTADGATRIIDWILASGATATYTCSNPDRCAEHDGDTPHSIAIRTLEGTMSADLGDWIIKGVAGEFYPCRDDIFRATYEAVD